MSLKDHTLAVWRVGVETVVPDMVSTSYDMKEWTNQLSTNPLLLINMGKLDLYPRMQRRSEAWDRTKRRAVIAALMKGYSIGVITIRYHSDTNTYSMIDGSHRLSTILNMFVRNDKIKYRGKVWSKLSPNQQSKFLNAKLAVVIYKDITDEEASELFQQLNSGESLNEPELLNCICSPPSDFVRRLTNNEHKTDVEPWAEKLLGYEKHKFFKLLGKKWNTRHGHELMAATVMYNSFVRHYYDKDLYTKGAANTKEGRRKMYVKYGNFGEPSKGLWVEMSNDDFKSQEKIIKNVIRIFDIMHSLVESAPKGKASFGSGATPGAVFWNLYHFVLGLELEYGNSRTKPVFKNPQLFVDHYLTAHDALNVKNPDGTDSVYKSINGKWMPTQHRTRNELLLNQMRKDGEKAWGLVIRDTQRSFAQKDQDKKYLEQKRKCAISGEVMAQSAMDAHHYPKAYEDGGLSVYENLQMVGRDNHHNFHAGKAA